MPPLAIAEAELRRLVELTGEAVAAASAGVSRALPMAA